MKSPLLIIIVTMLVVPGVLAVAGTSGKIVGEVKDTQSGEALVGANVVIEGTTMGAATNVEGFYTILNVPPGRYTLVASAVGYNKMAVASVSVSIDLTTTIDFKLVSTVVEVGEEVVVTAQRPLVQKDLTASTAVVGDKEIQSLPVTEFQDLLRLQAGVVDGHFRGGRDGEVSYWIDGVPITDAYNGATVVDVNKNSIQELQLVTGAFNAEYGKALSGIVNIATKGGSNQMAGSFTGYGGGYVTAHSDIWTGLQTVRPFGFQNLEGSLSGPIVSDKLFYYADIRYYYTSGSLWGVRKFNTFDITNATDANANNWVIGKTGDGKLVTMSPYLKGYAQAKISYNITPSLQASYNFIMDNSRGKDFDFSYKYNPDGILSNYKKGFLNSLNITHTLGASTFYTVGVSHFLRDERHYLDNSDFRASNVFTFTSVDPFSQESLGNVYDPATGAFLRNTKYVNTRLIMAPESTFLTGGTNMFVGTRSTETIVAKLDITSQVSREHQLKGGIEFNKYRLTLHNVNLLESDVDINRDPVVDGNPFLEGPILLPGVETQNNLQYLHKPTQLALYIQDKMEYQSVIINFGVRFDWFNPDGQVLADPSDPNIYYPLRPENQDSVVVDASLYHDQTSLHNAAVAARRAYWYKKATNKWKLSPRFGLSFPITDRGIVHFSYGLFFQTPSFERLYENPDYKLRLGGSTNLGIVGNPDLKPEETTSGELGLQQQLTDDISADVTLYFRDIRNLTGTLNEVEYVFGGTATYSKYVNSDFGFVRGIVLSVNKRFSGGLSASMDYTFQIAKGNASDPAAAYNQRSSGVLPETQLIPLDWDQHHTLNATLNYSHADDWGGSVVFTFGSGTPYTPLQISNAGEFVYNSGLKPSTYDVDLRLFKNFRFGAVTLSVFARVYNLLDTKNATSVYTDTGLPDVSLQGERLAEVNPNPRIASIQDWYTHPFFYSDPRRIEFGTTISF